MEAAEELLKIKPTGCTGKARTSGTEIPVEPSATTKLQ
jgi:hypothetical protein